MVRKIIEKEVQDFVWVAVLTHKQSKIWNEHTDIKVFEDFNKAHKWATKECHRLLNNIVSMGIMPDISSVKWFDNNLSMTILNKDNDGVLKVTDQTDVFIYKKEIF